MEWRVSTEYNAKLHWLKESKMYTVNRVNEVSKEKPSSWILNTNEGFDLVVEYRYGFIFVKVNDETLHKARLTTDITDGKLLWNDFLNYAEEYLPEEMIDFSLIKIKTNGKNEI